jgi:lysophospholipase L1-like esterase
LPAKAEGIVRPPVWSLSHHSAGIAVRFKTDATKIHAKWSLLFSSLAMVHMPATGVSGLDLYVKTKDGRWRWLSGGRPTKFPENRATLANGIPDGTREYLLYLPLYNGVTSVAIGIPKQSQIWRVEQAADVKPLVFYGTSITQGGCASRPGMVHTAILGRRLNHPVINLGFSGNGRMEQELAELLAELDVAAYVIDCLPNIVAKEVAERTEPLVRTLRKAKPSTPILLVEDRSYTDSFLVTSKRHRNEQSRAALLAAFKRLQADGVEDLYYLEGEHQLGDDGEATVDSSHPTDLGFVRMADAFEPVLRKMLAD